MSSSSFDRDNDLCITVLPCASTACALSVVLARSIPMAVIFMVDSFARLERFAPSNDDLVANRTDARVEISIRWIRLENLDGNRALRLEYAVGAFAVDQQMNDREVVAFAILLDLHKGPGIPGAGPNVGNRFATAH
jgi:hypothetical protein